MDSDTSALVERLIHTWDGDLPELIELVEMVGRIRKRAAYVEHAIRQHAERRAVVYEDAAQTVLGICERSLRTQDTDRTAALEEIQTAMRRAWVMVRGEL